MTTAPAAPALRWGVLSTANIGTEKVIPATQGSVHNEVVAIASRELGRAQAAADALGLGTAHGSYEALLADPGVDAIYNPLPNHLHVDWTIKAMEAGKHVLCEKPIGLDVADARRLVEATRDHPDVVVMEAFMYRFHPQWLKAKQLVDEGALGRLVTTQTFFSYFNDDPDNIRQKPEWGGGGMLDIGCYPVSQARWLVGRNPDRVLATMEIDPRFGTDRFATATLDFGDVVTTFTCSTQLSGHQRATLVGTEGRFEIEIPVNAPADEPTRAWLTIGSRSEELTFDVCDQYGLQADAFAKAVFAGEPAPTPLDDAVANMAVLDALFESANSDRWATPTT